MTVLDTNVIPEIFKPIPSEKVLEWLAAQDAGSVLTIAISGQNLSMASSSFPRGTTS